MRLEPLAPAGTVPVERDSVLAWVASRQPVGNTLVRFKWSLDENGSRVGGRGSVRVAAPDSLRFDVRGPLGAGAAAAVVVGDSWVDGVAATAAGLPFVAYRADRAELARRGVAPVAWLDDLAALPGWLARRG